MLHILFLILKIIGMILLAMVGILILLMCTVILMPANYLIQTKTDDGINTLSFEAKVNWFLHLFSAYYIYKDNESDWQVRIGWKRFNHKDHDLSTRSENVNHDVVVEEIQGSFDVSNDVNAKEQAKQSWFKKIKCTILKKYDRIKSFWETKKKWSEFLTNDVHVEAFKIIKTEIEILARHLRPRRITGYIGFGFDDPYRTGQILAGLSMLYPFYGENVYIYPDFEKKKLDADLYVKGHIRMVHLMMLLWRLFFNRCVRTTYRDYKKLKTK